MLKLTVNGCCSGNTNKEAEFSSATYTYLPLAILSKASFAIVMSHFFSFCKSFKMKGPPVLLEKCVGTRVHDLSINTLGGKVAAPDLILAGITGLHSARLPPSSATPLL